MKVKEQTELHSPRMPFFRNVWRDSVVVILVTAISTRVNFMTSEVWIVLALTACLSLFAQSFLYETLMSYAVLLVLVFTNSMQGIISFFASHTGFYLEVLPRSQKIPRTSSTTSLVLWLTIGIWIIASIVVGLCKQRGLPGQLATKLIGRTDR